MISTRNVSASIGGSRIIAGIDFELRPGEIAVVVGPNGSGKSTLLKTLSGDLPYQGEILFNTRDLRTMKPRDAALIRAVLPQATVLSFPFTVREVVRLGMLAGRSGALAGEDARLPDRALAKVDLTGFGGRFYQELSGGEQQRVQLARVLCQVWAPVLEGKPRYLLLDEPVSSLDIRHQLLVMEIARDFARRGGGVVAILHDLNLAAMYASRMLVLHRGSVAASGTPREVLSDELIARVFECHMKVGTVPAGDIPFVLPQTASSAGKLTRF
ncbi:heme ABC transporter ATP-binding protein [Mesorhizobium sp. BAC0120]|uniref:heme ABC transporter ATP-binding protein n=1 Tax=Mesorhizobium sp. BAC0120 TaxID=3090670 RepID=UPI00298C963D|nr:heme ABC transporter ATP-binding protein [Mesorhizobium sp. BAC0120]MDW6025833.1 heme ABC transporter ATP-binding protein [Mesorhizobium sp. BAC0120]